MVSGTRCPYVGVCKDELVRGAAAPEGPMTYDSTWGNFLRFPAYIRTSPPSLKTGLKSGLSDALDPKSGLSDRSHMVSGTHCPYVGVCKDELVKGAAAPEGPMTYDST